VEWFGVHVLLIFEKNINTRYGLLIGEMY